MRILLATAVTGFLLSGFAEVALSQSYSLNGQIEGTVVDKTGSAVVDASVVVTNIETGAARSGTTDQNGVFRFPLLPLGTYRIASEASGFRPVILSGITLHAGQARNIELPLDPGEISEALTILGDAPVADTGKTDLGRVMNSREVHNVPLPTRNPYNFVILQANVTGHPNRGNLYPQVNVNGFLRRTYWQLDGNSNTLGQIAGARAMHVSETYVAEMQLLAPGFAAEFGNSTGMIVNMVTPSGTNGFHGSGMFLFTRPSFYARPFFFSGEKLSDSMLNDVAVSFGGPAIKDRWHFYFGHEGFVREDNTSRGRQVSIKDSHKRDLIAAGLPASIFLPSIPGDEVARYYILRTDLQLNGNNRLTVRFNHAGVEKENGSGGFNTWERSTDLKMFDYSMGTQLVSFSQSVLNELRIQFVRSRAQSARNENSGIGISVNINNVANFGSPGNGGDSIGIDTQIQDNFTWTRGAHAIKFGAGLIVLDRFNRDSTSALYTFPSISAWQDARSGTGRPYGYTRYQETFGDPETRLNTTYWNLFVQDEWKATRRLKFNYGLRYDLYVVPDADPTAPHSASRKFNVDKNNFAPRFGFVYALREGNRPLVIRAGAGIYYEPAWTAMYTKALRHNGNPSFFNIQFQGTDGYTRKGDPLAPAFPNTFSGTQPPGSPVPRSDIITIAPDFENMYAIHSNIQLEQALTEDLSLTVGYVHSGGRHIPVHRSINAFDPIRYLADGRPVFGTARLDPRFNIIQMAESAGVSQYDAFTFQLSQRFSRGIQFSANYTLSRAVDDAPEQEVTYDDGGRNLRALSDPTNRSFDKGYSYGDQRHTFVMSFVARPTVNVQNRSLRFLLNNNQFGIIARASSGERFTVRTAGDTDLNGDGLYWPDRPVGIKRNSGKTPPQFNLDLRYSRFIEFTESYRIEVLGEVQNLFNVNNIVGFNNITVPVDSRTGKMIGPMPDFKATGGKALESRHVQIGVKFHF